MRFAGTSLTFPLLFAAACIGRAGAKSSKAPDVPPVLLTANPFRYPASLWAQRLQGDVTLAVFVDSAGIPVADSTAIHLSSGFTALDSAAMSGVAQLQFRPATYHGAPVGVRLLLPVLFRHPDAPPVPGDSAIKRTTRPPLPT